VKKSATYIPDFTVCTGTNAAITINQSLFESGKSPYTDTHTHAQNTIYNKRRNYETVEKKLDQ